MKKRQEGSGWRCRRYEASYTVEASFIMAIVLFTMVSLIQFAYRQCRQTNGNMRLEEMVEVLRHRETIPGDSLSVDTVPYQIEAERGLLTVSGHVSGDGWSLNIESGIYEPEEFMRLLTLIQE